MAVRPATTPAITNDRITAGPAVGTASVRITKMPVPIVAPTPNSVSWNRPIVRASSPPPVSAPVSADMTPTGFRRNSFCRSDTADVSGCTAAIELLLVLVPHVHPLAKRRRWQPSRAPSREPRFGSRTTGRTRAGARGSPHAGDDRDAARHLRDPRVLPHQPDADLLHLADRVQPARHRPLAAQLLLHQLLRLVRRHAPARVRAEGAAVPRVRVDGGHLQLPPRPQGGARPHRCPGQGPRAWQVRVRDVRRRDRTGRSDGRARGRAPERRAPAPA